MNKSDEPTLEEAIEALRNLWNAAQDVLSNGYISVLYQDGVLLNAEGVLARYEEANE